MLMDLRRALTTALLAAALYVSAATPSAANDDAYIAYRQQMMQAVGGNAAAIGTIMRKRLPLNDHMALHADQIASAARMVPGAFKSKVFKGATDAKPEIWTSMEEFLELNEAMREASLEFAEAAREGDPREIAAAFRDLTKSCGACHRPYRKPKQQSYKSTR